MALSHWQRTIVDSQGNALAGATVEVRSETTGNLAPLKANRAGTAGKSNPFAADADGFAEFYLRGGAYQIVATKGALTQTWRYVPIGTAQEVDIEAVHAYSGMRYLRSILTGDDAAPGTLRGNNANLTGATILYFAAEDANGNDQGNRIAAFGDGTSDIRGFLVLRQLSAGGEIAFRIIGPAVDLRPSPAVIAVPVAFESGADVFVDADGLTVERSRTGDKGGRSTILVGTVDTVAPGDPATVTNVGNELDAIFNFEIPQGETGAAGPPVSDGDKGDIVVSGSGATWSIDPAVATAAGRTLMAAANAAAQAGLLPVLRYDAAQTLTAPQQVLAQVNAGVASLPGSRSLIASNNSGTPNTQFDIVAQSVVLRDASGNTFLKLTPGTKTCNVSTAGPAANGRDQAGAFSANSWVHFWWIGKTDGTVDTIASASGAAPTLPATYTHYAYIGAVRFNGSSNLVRTRIIGGRAYLDNSINVAQAVAGSVSATEQTVSVASYVPPNAIDYQCGVMVNNTDAAAAANITIRVVSLSDYARIFSSIGATTWADASPILPNVGQQFFWIGTTANIALYLWIMNYSLPNGAT